MATTTSGQDPSATTETLVKDGGTSWQYAADLPTPRIAMKGLGLDNGQFILTGQ